MSGSPYRSPTGRFIRWPLVIQDARNRGDWMLLEEAGPIGLVQIINERRVSPLQRIPDGRLRARLVNEHTHNRRQRGDIYVRFERKP